MNLFQRAIRSCLRKPVKSILLLLVIGTISLLFLSGMASRSANIAAKDSTRQAIGAGFLLEGNPENRNKRLQEAFKAIEEKFESDKAAVIKAFMQKRSSAMDSPPDMCGRIILLNPSSGKTLKNSCCFRNL